MFNDIGQYFNLLKNGDPLKVYIEDGKPIADELEIGVKALENHVFFPSVTTMPAAIDGHGQTLMVGVKDFYRHTSERNFEYDKRMLFKLSDGG